MFTEGATSLDKVAEYWQLDNPQPLVHAGQPVLDWTGSATPPGTQLVVDFDNDGTRRRHPGGRAEVLRSALRR